MTDLRPSEGIRILLARREVADDGASARYDAGVFTPDREFSYDALLERSGQAELTPRGERAETEDEEALLKLARSAARASARRLADGLEPWPPRILRWRGPGRG